MNAVTTPRQTTGKKLHGVADGLFSLGDWHIVAIAEGIQGSEVIHVCKYGVTGEPSLWCYSIYDTVCPGCGEAQPDEIQALDQMMNADHPDRFGIVRLLDRSMKQMFWYW